MTSYQPFNGSFYITTGNTSQPQGQCYRCLVTFLASSLTQRSPRRYVCQNCLQMMKNNPWLIRAGGMYPECHGCGEEKPGCVLKQHEGVMKLLCPQCAIGEVALDKWCTCEECKRAYWSHEKWPNERVCEPCMSRIRKEVGEPPLDSDLSADERQYLAETFGLQEYRDEQLEKDAPFCRSCIEHGPDRENYACLQTTCAWEAGEKKRLKAEALLKAKASTQYKPTWSTFTDPGYRFTNSTISNNININYR